MKRLADIALPAALLILIGFVWEGAVRYWEVMAHVRWAVIALQQAERHLSGVEPDIELALIGRRLAELEYELLAMTAVA